MAKLKGYKIETARGIENLSRILIQKLRECTETGKDLIVYVSVKLVKKEAREFDRVRDTNRLGEP